eukprot:COSAG03_NODE_604_length_6749_cov_25.742556_1_plen_194_part_00
MRCARGAKNAPGGGDRAAAAGARRPAAAAGIRSRGNACTPHQSAREGATYVGISSRAFCREGGGGARSVATRCAACDGSFSQAGSRGGRVLAGGAVDACGSSGGGPCAGRADGAAAQRVVLAVSRTYGCGWTSARIARCARYGDVKRAVCCQGGFGDGVSSEVRRLRALPCRMAQATRLAYSCDSEGAQLTYE